MRSVQVRQQQDLQLVGKPTVADAAQATEVMLAAYKSAATGEAVQLPL